MKKFLVYSLILVMLLSLCGCSFNVTKRNDANKDVDINVPSNEELDEETNPTANGDTEVDPGIEEMIAKNNKEQISVADDIKAYLLLGIDRGGVASTIGTDVGGGQSDSIYVIAMNNVSKTIKILQINRDTYTDVIIPDAFGKPMTTTKERLGLAFSSGSGLQDSCVNAERSISNFLHGLEFDGYVAIYYDAIAPVVDSVGGVDITIQEDMTAVSPSFTSGSTLHMDGHDAYLFCRARTAVGDQSNIGRMRRQRTFLDSFLAVCRLKIKEQSSIVNDMYNASSQYIVSDLSKGELCNIAVKALGYNNCGIVTPAGTDKWVTGDDGIRFSQFTVNEDNLSEILCDFFAPPRLTN